MKAILFNGERLEEIRMPKPRLRRGEAVVQVLLAGICATDLEITRGYMEFRGVPGHEFVGIVVSSSKRELMGQRVVGEINIPCRKCSMCRSGLGKHCPNRSILGISKRNGAFAEYLSLPVHNLHPVPRQVSNEEAVFTELLAAACEIPTRVRFPARSRVAVLGDGRLAAMAAQVLSLKTGKVTVFGQNPMKLSVIKRIGITARDISQRKRFSQSFDTVVECTGKPAGLALAAELVRPQGTIVLKSTYHGQLNWNPAPIVIDEMTVIGSRCGPFDEALKLLARGKIETTPFLTATYPFHRWRAAFRCARQLDSFKVLLQIR